MQKGKRRESSTAAETTGSISIAYVGLLKVGAIVLLDGIKINEYQGIYYPREDSYLLAYAVEKYAFGSALDMGTGTGLLGIIAAKKGCKVTFADIDQKALAAAKANAAYNNVKGKFVETDMFSSIKEKYNTIIFNPPYLESLPLKELDKKEKREFALDGGRKGRELIDLFLKEYKKHVEERHCVLLLESTINNFKKDAERLNAEVVGKENFFFEELAVLKFE